MAKRPDPLQREKKTLLAMLEIYCRNLHRPQRGRRLCPECTELWEYARRRLDKCPFGPDKGPCSKCHIHCYKPQMRRRIQQVMRYSGPKMLTRHPVMAVRHLLQGRKEKDKPEE